MEGVHLKTPFPVNWSCESGLVENMALVVEEYRQTRGLLVGATAESRHVSCVPVQRVHQWNMEYGII